MDPWMDALGSGLSVLGGPIAQGAFDFTTSYQNVVNPTAWQLHITPSDINTWVPLSSPVSSGSNGFLDNLGTGVKSAGQGLGSFLTNAGNASLAVGAGGAALELALAAAVGYFLYKEYKGSKS